MSVIHWNPFLIHQLKPVVRFDAHSLRVAVLLGAIAILNLIDLFYTLFAHNIGLLNELNPVTAAFIHTGYINSLIFFKIFMVVGGLGLIWKLRRNRLIIPGCWILLGVYIWLSVVWIQWVQTVNQIFEIRLTASVP